MGREREAYVGFVGASGDRREGPPTGAWKGRADQVVVDVAVNLQKGLVKMGRHNRMFYFQRSGKTRRGSRSGFALSELSRFSLT